ncbi:N-acetylglucosamine kinase [Cryobacterium sp. TMT2-4]|uniref:N-acetylglucosamine kinase n=1 Tax=Cryobacterium sp. TMT2-4 TaxID=1259254 RepID=UPI00106A31C7|nr:ATPase [Cryobacterium sp. TMT2-4]
MARSGPIDPSRLVLGIDVGNSKTHVAVTDRAGRLVGSTEGPGLCGLPVDPALQLEALLQLVDDAVGIRVDFAAAAFAMAGLDLPVEEERMSRLVREAGVSERAVVLNDTFALLRTGSPSGKGIAVVAGAGINCVAVDGDRSVRFHSMGRISGDWGGGQDVGEEALAVACRAEDGRGPATLLSERVPRHFAFERPLQVAEAVQLQEMPRSKLVELAPVAFAAALDGDDAAIAIVHRLADEVAAFIETALRRLGSPPAEVPVLLGGGLLQSGNAILMHRILATPALTGIAVSIAGAPPIVGSVLLAFDQLSEDPPDAHTVAEQWASRAVGCAATPFHTIGLQAPAAVTIGPDPVEWTPHKRECSLWQDHVGTSPLSTKTRL